jgi:hypothetical protein
MPANERRRPIRPSYRAMVRELTEAQQFALSSLEQAGWTLTFVRQAPATNPTPVIYDRERMTYAVIESDGQLNEHPRLVFRS